MISAVKTFVQGSFRGGVPIDGVIPFWSLKNESISLDRSIFADNKCDWFFQYVS